jgi:hypothetical protein
MWCIPGSVYACFRDGFISAVDIGLRLLKLWYVDLDPGN